MLGISKPQTPQISCRKLKAKKKRWQGEPLEGDDFTGNTMLG